MPKKKSLLKICGPIEVKGRKKEYIEDIFKEADRHIYAYSERQAMFLFAQRFAKILGYEKHAVYIGEAVISYPEKKVSRT